MRYTVTKKYAEDGKEEESYSYDDFDSFAKYWPLFAHPIKVYGDRFNKMVFALDTEEITIKGEAS